MDNSEYSEIEQDYVFKIVLIGEPAVGKSNILSRFTQNTFCKETRPTIGVEFATRVVEIDGKSICGQVWDTAGQDQYRAIVSAFYRGALGAFIVYDITRRHSFESIKKWIEELNQYAAPSVKVLLVGNKVDMNYARAVKAEEGMALANSGGYDFLETSAKDDINIYEAFYSLMTKIYESNKDVDVDDDKDDEPIAIPDGVDLSRSREEPNDEPCSC
eukprot:TRINITY_DN2709_c0_g1_i1.p1 TRINITY_DN2709_c0_g1~~TRINITY_DN2709_c0_g1_i1.p1  ORF type:complete len:232 (+),score=72.38 TRINITY_DN2709_c0_g1_i1:49-696(+)